MAEKIHLVIKWSGKEYEIEDVALHWSVFELKEEIYKKTFVKPERQKLLGLKYKGRYELYHSK